MNSPIEVLSYIISQGGYFKIEEGKISVGFPDSGGLTTTMPQMFCYDFNQGLDQVMRTMESVVKTHQTEKEIDTKVKAILSKEGFDNTPAYNKFYDVIRYLIRNKTDLSGDKC